MTETNQSYSEFSSIWSNVIDQSKLVDNLLFQIKTNSLSNAYYFCGPPGSGRSVLAADFACSILCETPLENGSACLCCTSCKMFQAKTHPDFELVQTSSVIIPIDRIREATSLSNLNPTYSKRRIVMIENADRIQLVSQNALLKSLEDTPRATIWILCAPTTADVLPTIISRCRVEQLKQPSNAAIENALKQLSEFSDDKIKAAVRLANGNIGLAKHLAKNDGAMKERVDLARLSVSIRLVSDVVFEVESLCKRINKEAADQVELKIQRDILNLREQLGLGEKEPFPKKMNRFLKEINDAEKREIARIKKDRFSSLVLDVMMVYRDIALIQAKGDEDRIINLGLIDLIKKYAAALTEVEVALRTEKINMALERLKTNTSEQLILENLFCELLVPARIV